MTSLAAAATSSRARTTIETTAVRHKFAAVTDTNVAAAIPLDYLPFVGCLRREFAAVSGVALAISIGNQTTGTCSVAFERDDGFTLAFGLPAGFAAAIVGVRCGGAFESCDITGPSVDRVVHELEQAVLRAADAAWSGHGIWSPCRPVPAAHIVVDLGAAGGEFSLTLGVTLPLAAVADAGVDDAVWLHRLRLALDATPFAVRALLHERDLSLGEALALRPGDVLPIDTLREVSLLLGDRTLAWGSIVPDGEGGHRVTIASLDRTGVAPHAPSGELP